jgi:hypothetical protein
MNDWIIPMGSEEDPGVTAMETSAGGSTVSVLLPTTCVLGSVAEIVVTPAVKAVASPWLPAATEIVATLGAEDAHVTVLVTSAIDPSL